MEESITKQTKAQMLDLIKASDKGSDPLDKLRLFLQWCVMCLEFAIPLSTQVPDYRARHLAR